MPITAAVISDLRVRAVLAAHDMAVIAFTPSRSMVAEDVRNLQNWTCHQRRASSGRLVLLADEMIERAGDVTDRIGGDLRVARRRVELGVPEQHLDHANIDVLLQEMGGKAVPQRMRRQDRKSTRLNSSHL